MLFLSPLNAIIPPSFRYCSTVVIDCEKRGKCSTAHKANGRRKKRQKMLKTTEKAVGALLACDPSITQEQIRSAIATLSGKASDALTDPTPIDRALPRDAVAKILGVSRRTVTLYARRGIIRACRFGEGGKRACGYSERSVREAMAKRTDGKEA